MSYMKQKRYTKQEITRLIKDFHSVNNRYPTANDFDGEQLPAVRTIQREFGGLIKMREELGFPITSYGRGEERSKMVTKINETSYYAEHEVHRFLLSQFKIVRYQPSFEEFQIDGTITNRRADFMVSHQGKNIIIDVFNPKDLHSLQGCLNQKTKNYTPITNPKNHVFFVCTTPHITQEEVDNINARRKTKLQKNQKVMHFNVFKDYITTLTSPKFMV